MLEALGLSSHTEAVYLAMLKCADRGVNDLARSLELDPGQVIDALDELERMALLRSSLADPQELHPVDPGTGLPALVARRQAEFARQAQELEESKAAVATLLAEHAELHPPAKAPDVEYVEGVDAIRSRLHELTSSCRWEVCSFVPGEAQIPMGMAVDRALDAAALERGLRARTVLLDSIRNHQPTLDYVQWLVDSGSEVRTVPLLPLRMVIVDRERALVPADPDSCTDVAVVVSSPGMVRGLLALFGSVWRSANPLGGTRRRDEDGLCAQRRQVLRLLAEGCTDDTIARRLGVSIRTARRVASDLLGRLHARSRFQAGAHAVARGWIGADDLDLCV
jgi:sugar-specific transcriptional regulator TrmB/DNA-binding CsgD family transcriptional regulator